MVAVPLPGGIPSFSISTMGLIISTADTMTKEVEEAIDKLQEESGKPVAILVGEEVAAFMLRYGAKLLA